MDNDEAALVQDSAVRLQLGLEVALLIPPLIPSRLDSDGTVGLVVGVVERLEDLLLTLGGVLDVLGERLLLLLGGLGLLFLGLLGGGSALGLGLGFLLELGLLGGLLALLFDYRCVSLWHGGISV